MPSNPYGPKQSARLTAAPADADLIEKITQLGPGHAFTLAVRASAETELSLRAGAISVRREDFVDYRIYEVRGWLQTPHEGDVRRPELAFDAYDVQGACAAARLVRDRLAAIGPVADGDPDA